MQAKPIDLTPFMKATAQLKEAITFWQACDPASPLKPHLRSAVIQSFEFTYELAVRNTRRVLVERAASAELVHDLSFLDLLRSALDAGLPMNMDSWRRWRDMRNATSHAYDEQRAQEVALTTPEFVVDVEKLLLSLQAAGGQP